MRPVSAALQQRFANQFAFDRGNGATYQEPNGFDFRLREFGVTKDHARHDGRVRMETVAQRHLPQRGPPVPSRHSIHGLCSKWRCADAVDKRPRDTPSLHKLSIKNQKKLDLAIGETWEAFSIQLRGCPVL